MYSFAYKSIFLSFSLLLMAEILLLIYAKSIVSDRII